VIPRAALWARQLVAVAALCVTLGAAPQSTTSSPTPATAASSLPEIGRTKAFPVACGVLRDLVAPSLGAAIDADAAFGNARAQLDAYGVLMGGRRPNTAVQTLSLMRLGRNVTAMAKDVLTINRALGDPRVAASQTDTEAHTLRVALQQLYEAENTKLNELSGYVEGEYANQLLGDDETIAQLRATTSNAAPRAAQTLLAKPAPFDGAKPAPLPRIPGPGQTPDVLYAPPPLASHEQERDRDRAADLEAKASRAIVAASDACR
jgi:hypothetical protein